MGVTVRQKVPGRGKPWWIYIHRNGQILSRKVGDRRAAEAVASAIRRKLKAGEFATVPKSKTPRFDEYAGRYLETYAKVACKWSTWKSYETIVNLHLIPSWRNKRLDQITRADVKRLILQKQRDGLKPATVENIKALVSGIFTHAYEDEILTVNPALKLGKYIKREGRRHHVKPLTRELTIHFLGCVREHFPHQYPFMLCAFRTGMRLGELLGLAWADLDFGGNAIEIRRSYSHGRFSTPKSNKARLVDMSDQLRATLLEHRETLRQRFGGQLPVTQLPDGSLVELVFPARNGQPLCGDNFRGRAFRKMIEVADVPRFRFHDIRHTFASLLLAQGESLHYVKEQMGHASIQTTVDVYGHLVPGSNRNAVNRLDDPDEPGLRVVPAEAG